MRGSSEIKELGAKELLALEVKAVSTVRSGFL